MSDDPSCASVVTITASDELAASSAGDKSRLHESGVPECLSGVVLCPLKSLTPRCSNEVPTVSLNISVFRCDGVGD